MKYLRAPTQNFFELFKKAGVLDKLALILSSFFGVGRIPIVPGTCATLAGILLAIAFAHLEPMAGTVALFLFILLSIWASDKTAKALKNHDPAEVVIDEVAGLLLTLYLLPATGFNLCLSFVLFRVFDILKPYPIRRLEKVRGGAGIVLDDLLAGIYANLCIRIVSLVFP
ncbi:Phosphatidylglycerophosphatase A [sediment metagenome]|uniref:Phosphatidylglycerophosphatase A n=1 Tax=sediment metagenome TaxID=749907 RepID=D9PKV9_9ZZZZ